MHLKTHMKVPLEYLIWDALGPMIPNPATLSVSSSDARFQLFSESLMQQARIIP